MLSKTFATGFSTIEQCLVCPWLRQAIPVGFLCLTRETNKLWKFLSSPSHSAQGKRGLFQDTSTWTNVSPCISMPEAFQTDILQSTLQDADRPTCLTNTLNPLEAQSHAMTRCYLPPQWLVSDVMVGPQVACKSFPNIGACFCALSHMIA